MLLGIAIGIPQDLSTVADIHGKGQTISTKFGKVYYETEGEGPVVILIAGGPGGTHTSFHGYFNRLAKDHKVVYFDSIGRGRSDRLTDPKGYTVWRDAEDVEALRIALKVDKVTVLGHSYGGMPAIAYAVNYGDHLGRLILSDTLHSGVAFQANIDSCNYNAANLYPDVWEKLLAMRKKGVKSSAEAYGDLYGFPTNTLYWYDEKNGAKMYRSKDPKDGFNGEVYSAMLGDDPEWKVGGTMKSFDPRKKMKGIKVPTLVCVGRYDRVATPKIAYEISKLIPNSQIAYFDHSGHRPWVEESDAYFTRVQAFLSGISK